MTIFNQTEEQNPTEAALKFRESFSSLTDGICKFMNTAVSWRRELDDAFAAVPWGLLGMSDDYAPSIDNSPGLLTAAIRDLAKQASQNKDVTFNLNFGPGTSQEDFEKTMALVQKEVAGIYGKATKAGIYGKATKAGIKSASEVREEERPGHGHQYATGGPLLELDARLAKVVEAVYDELVDVGNKKQPWPAIDDLAIDEIKAVQAWARQNMQDGKVPDTGCNGLDTVDRVRFYEHDFYMLSNFSSFRVRFNGHDYQTAEHAYQAAKFNGGHPNMHTAIMYAASAHEAFKLAEQNKHLRNPHWEDIRVSVMKRILRAKVSQHEYVRLKLLATGDRELVEDSWRDDFWGWGPNRDGQNMLGKLWMQIREELRSKANQGEDE